MRIFYSFFSTLVTCQWLIGSWDTNATAQTTQKQIARSLGRKPVCLHLTHRPYLSEQHGSQIQRRVRPHFAPTPQKPQIRGNTQTLCSHDPRKIVIGLLKKLAFSECSSSHPHYSLNGVVGSVAIVHAFRVYYHLFLLLGVCIFSRKTLAETLVKETAREGQLLFGAAGVLLGKFWPNPIRCRRRWRTWWFLNQPPSLSPVAGCVFVSHTELGSRVSCLLWRRVHSDCPHFIVRHRNCWQSIRPSLGAGIWDPSCCIKYSDWRVAKEGSPWTKTYYYLNIL